MVSSIREKGVPEFIDVQDAMKAEVIKDKKAERLIKQMTGIKNLNTLAKKGNTIVNKAEVIFSQPQIQGGGYEPELVGSIFSGLKDGQFTKPIKGESGVYVVRLNKTLKAPATSSYTIEASQLLGSYRSNIQNEVKMALIKLSDVKDNRKFNSLGIRR
jgi:hypothetical protein